VTAKWVVLKFGGTSVSGPAQWETISALVQQRLSGGFRVLVVCSAVAGVTNQLSALAQDPASEATISGLLQRHKRLSGELGISTDGWLEEAELLLRDCAGALTGDSAYSAQARLLAVGEWLSTRIGALYLRQFVDVSWVDVRGELQVVEEPELSEARRWLSARCAPGPDIELQRRWDGLAPVVITQGFIAGTATQQTALLGRGGSDTSAALLAGRLSALEVEIWTDVPGLFSADPHLVPEARLLAELHFDEALEMAASGARVVHPDCIRTAAATGTPVVIRDSARPQLRGTRISGNGDSSSTGNVPGVKSITCQKGMEVLLLQNIDSRRQVGFLARVFDIFRRHGVSIDLVATSETTTTVSINGPANHLDKRMLANLVTDLQPQCMVKVYSNCVCINLVGRAVRTAFARLQSAVSFFEDHPLLMLSQSANDLCLSLLIESRDHENFLASAHATLIPAGAASPVGVFGSRWIEILNQT